MSISVEDLTKIYGKGDTEVKALDGVTTSIENGEFVAVIGASGSGKTTLLHLIGGLDSPTDGKVLFDGADIYTLGDKGLSEIRRKKCGFVFQFFNLIPELTARENIILPILLDNGKVDDSYIGELSEMLGISDRLAH
ncbi:MAG: ABC transporter ATP-binding protein, partial [Oscillospiraceae bacterium]|nr:ABC transporter ATP-binding protein [Oscillospiraceae bacterium]